MDAKKCVFYVFYSLILNFAIFRVDASPQVQLVNWQHNVSKSKYFVLKKSILKIPFQYFDFTWEEERNIREMIFYCFFPGQGGSAGFVQRSCSLGGFSGYSGRHIVIFFCIIVLIIIITIKIVIRLLKFQGVKREDSGLYSCSASNSVGEGDTIPIIIVIIIVVIIVIIVVVVIIIIIYQR